MNEILVGNSFCRLQNFGEKETEVLAEAISYTDEDKLFEAREISTKVLSLKKFYNSRKDRIKPLAAKKMRYMIHKLEGIRDKLLNEANVCFLKDDSFPTGHLKLVSDALKESRVDFKVSDLRLVPKPKGLFKDAKPLAVKPRYYQEIFHKEALKNHRGVCVSAVGSGKSLLLERFIREFDQKSLIVTPGSDLAIQLSDGLNESLGGSYSGILTTPFLRKVLAGKAVCPPIQIATVQGLAALQKSGLLSEALRGVGLLAIDECHHMGSATYVNLLPELDHIYYKFGFSGSFLRNDSKTLDMWGVLSDVLYEYPAHQAIEDGFLTPIEATIWEVKGIKKAKYQTEYTKNYCGNPRLLSKIADICTNFAAPKDQILILVNRKDKSGAVISQFLEDQGLLNTFISGDSPKADIKASIKAFNNREIRILIGSAIIGEGIDIRSTDHLIMAQGGKSPIQITQAVGRLVRLYEGKAKGYLHDFAFTGTKYMLKHTVERISLYESNFAAEVTVEEEY